MEKSYHVNAFEMVSKKGVLLSVLTLFIVFAALASMTTVVYAPVGEIPAGYLWVAQDKDGDPLTYDVGTEDFVQVETEYDVLPCNWYWIAVTHLPDEIEDGDYILIKVSNEDWEDARKVKVYEQDDIKFCEPSQWHCPEAPYCTQFRVLYKLSDLEPDTVVTNLDFQQIYVAMGLMQTPGILHVIPEFAFGTLIAMLSSLSGLAMFSKFRRR